MPLPQKPDYPNFKRQFRGGNDTAREVALLNPGDYSRIQNMRQMHSGMKQRPGQSRLHTVADSTNRVVSLFQFSKGKKTERHLFAQMSDSDILEFTNAPPAVTTGAMGSEVFSGTTGQIPASWSVIDDKMIFSNGVDQHQIYPGDDTPVEKFIVFRGTAAPAAIPAEGYDYSVEVADNDETTTAILDSLGTLATDFDCIFFMAPFPINEISLTVPTGKYNLNAAVMGLNYKKSTGAWAAVSGFTDNTASGGKTLAAPGTATMTWTLPTDSIPSFMYGRCGFWYQLYLSSGALSSEVEVSAVTYTAPWQGIQNVWDGVPIDIIEAQFYDQSLGTYNTFYAGDIDVSLMTTSDKLHFSSYDPIEAIYVNVGDTPNTTAGITLALYCWDGDEFSTVGTIEDGTNGLKNSGWVTFARPSSQPTQFNKTQYYAYWYYLSISGGTLSDDLTIGIKTAPYFDISELGKGLANIVWKGRGMYVFEKIPNWLIVSAKNQPMVLNGDDSTILEAGDGRSNKIVCMKKFHNEFMVWQEEKGVEGGCLTLFEGYSPLTFGKLVLSSSVGTFNAHSAVVVDGVLTSTRTDEVIKTMAFFLSHDGVCASDGTKVWVISDKIRNYFDPTKTECIRRGYEDKMWLKYDRAFNVLRIGLVSGASATECNIFLVYDIADGTWSFDVLGQELSTMEEIEAGSGDIARLQIGGGTDDGFAYLLNTGDNDVSTAIDSYATMEIDGGCDVISLTEVILRMAAGSGSCVLTVYEDGVALDYTKTIPP